MARGRGQLRLDPGKGRAHHPLQVAPVPARVSLARGDGVGPQDHAPIDALLGGEGLHLADEQAVEADDLEGEARDQDLLGQRCTRGRNDQGQEPLVIHRVTQPSLDLIDRDLVRRHLLEAPGDAAQAGQGCSRKHGGELAQRRDVGPLPASRIGPPCELAPRVFEERVQIRAIRQGLRLWIASSDALADLLRCQLLGPGQGTEGELQGTTGRHAARVQLEPAR